MAWGRFGPQPAAMARASAFDQYHAHHSASPWLITTACLTCCYLSSLSRSPLSSLSHKKTISYIYSYPDLALQHTLPAGTERSYSAACFSPDGTKLAAVGSAPDYLLTLWDWAAGATLLRCKAFSQEVYGLGFCPHSPGHLVSCGTGHIRFWKMASTFTGLKLQVSLCGERGCLRAGLCSAVVNTGWRVLWTPMPSLSAPLYPPAYDALMHSCMSDCRSHHTQTPRARWAALVALSCPMLRPLWSCQTARC